MFGISMMVVRTCAPQKMDSESQIAYPYKKEVLTHIAYHYSAVLGHMNAFSEAVIRGFFTLENCIFENGIATINSRYESSLKCLGHSWKNVCWCLITYKKLVTRKLPCTGVRG